MKHILFVDDEPRVLQGIRNSLWSVRREWAMTFVESGEAAVEHLERAPVDVIVTDMRMPGMGGLGLLRHVRERFPAVRCLALSGYAELAAQDEAEGLVVRFLAKPCDSAVLRRAIEHALETGVGTPGAPAQGQPA
jgi:CheY-like chemotaxis protein